MDSVFSLSGLLVMPIWAAMILLPRWRWTERVMRSPWSVAPAAALYAALVLPSIGAVWPAVSRPELGPVAALLGTPAGATIAWVHFLAFDLFVGRWAYLDSRERGISAWVMAPVLFLTLMLGPVGLLAYLAVRAFPALRSRPAPGRFRAVLEANRPLALVAALMVPLFLLSLVGVAIDSRLIGGAPAWVKPMKFALSISIYSFTLLWMLSLVKGHRRLVRTVGTATAVAFAVEWAVIALQAAKGTASHFNNATPLDAALFATMGVFVIVLWVMNLIAAGLLLRQRFASPSFAWSLRLGLLASLVGGVVATPMLGPTPEQMASLRAGERVEVIGAHSVGVPDGGPGLPVVGWSTRGGDLRVPHFFGLHGLQVVPLLGFLLGRARRLGEGHRLALVWTGGLAYLGLTGILFWQAMQGEPVVAPGPETLGAAGVLLAVSLLVAAGVLVDARRRGPAPAPLGLVAGGQAPAASG